MIVAGNEPNAQPLAGFDPCRSYHADLKTIALVDTATMPAQVKTRILFRSRRLNIYLVRYPEGHKVVPHVDMISEGCLYKFNCVLVRPKEGGEFICDKNIFNFFGRIYLFRPDLYQHRVSRIERGNRWLLSFALTTRGTT